MAKNQRSYTPEFKQQIVDLHCKAGKGITELSNEYGIPKGTISSWTKNLTPVINTGEETISLKKYKALQKKMKELEIEAEQKVQLVSNLEAKQKQQIRLRAAFLF